MASVILSRTRTLFELAGAPAWSRPDGQAAVILVDAQAEYRTGALPLDGIDAAATELALLRFKARELGWPVIHVRHIGSAGGFFDPEGQGGKFLDEALPEKGEIVVGKRLPNSFAGTDLDVILKRLGAKHLVIAGFMTHMCVSATARAALDLGYFSAIVAAACATRALPAPDGSVIAAADLHRAELAALGDRFARILPDAGAV